MSEPRMCGVVLWTSSDDGRAVIWCEDQGNLAFYKSEDGGAHLGLSLDPGDLIDFDLVDELDHRVAANPRLLVEDHAPNIANGLRGGTPVQKTKCAQEAGNIIPLPTRQKRRSYEMSVA